MTKDKEYTGIDIFRLVAAVLVVIIHTSPLASYSQLGDFVLTRIIARAAVPFFFITSGFFLIDRYSYNAEKLIIFVKRTALIYGVAILLYIPVNIYNGYFKMDNLLPNILKDIVFDGTLYHLWYLPASIVGAVIAWFLVRKYGFRKAIVLSLLFYVIGLFGDSYYGLVEENTIFDGLYNLIFQVSDYTRNGLFYAPVFFVLGGMIADKKGSVSFRKSLCGLCISLAFLLCEGMILHTSGMQKHDSMYVFLLPSMYYLFHVILHFKGKRIETLRMASMIIYIIHPLMIIAVRLFAKLLHLQTLLVENSLFHFLLVCSMSVILGLAGAILWNKLGKQRKKNIKDTDRACLEINLEYLEHNVNTLKKVLQPECELMAVVKADAYGHGMFNIAVHVNKLGVRAFAVATIDEGITLRKYGIVGEILILGYTEPERARELCKYHLTQTLIDMNYALLLSQQGCNIKTHIKIDTGMHRLGFDKEDVEGIVSVFHMKNLKVEGIFTHLCASDSTALEDTSFTKAQADSFYRLIQTLETQGITIPKIHIQSSYGLLNYPKLKSSYVRAGVILYGVLSSPNDNPRMQLDLKQVLSLKAKVILLRKVKKGDCVGYSRSFVAGRDSLIGVVPVGYADGYPRNLSGGKSYVLINGQKAPVVGKICMDQLMIDVTDISGVRVGDIVTLIGKDGNEEILAEMVAEKAESITNELLSRMGTRVKVSWRNN